MPVSFLLDEIVISCGLLCRSQVFQVKPLSYRILYQVITEPTTGVNEEL